jgi:hypothetical protein
VTPARPRSPLARRRAGRRDRTHPSFTAAHQMGDRYRHDRAGRPAGAAPSAAPPRDYSVLAWSAKPHSVQLNASWGRSRSSSGVPHGAGTARCPPSSNKTPGSRAEFRPAGPPVDATRPGPPGRRDGSGRPVLRDTSTANNWVLRLREPAPQTPAAPQQAFTSLPAGARLGSGCRLDSPALGAASTVTFARSTLATNCMRLPVVPDRFAGRPSHPRRRAGPPHNGKE